MFDFSETEDDDILLEALDSVERYEREKCDKEQCTEVNPTSSSSGTKTVSLPTEGTPLFLYRGTNHVSVSDLAGQLWCEQQVEYKYMFPSVHKDSMQNNSFVQKGSEIHLAKELEVNEVFDIPTHSREDYWALKFLNSYNQLTLLTDGRIVREFSVFGELMQSGIIARGTIDEVRHSSAGGLCIVELKTLSENYQRLPTARTKRDSFQVMLYRYLFENFRSSFSSKEFICNSFSLKCSMVLSEGVVSYAEDLGLNCDTLEDVLEALRNALTILPLPAVDSMLVEYCSQESVQPLFEFNVDKDNDWFVATVQELLSYWRGDRGAKGVEIEEAHKCAHCPYVDDCGWRLSKHEEYKKANERNFTNS